MEILMLLLGRMIILWETDEQFENLQIRIKWQTSKGDTVVWLRHWRLSLLQSSLPGPASENPDPKDEGEGLEEGGLSLG